MFDQAPSHVRSLRTPAPHCTRGQFFHCLPRAPLSHHLILLIVIAVLGLALGTPVMASPALDEGPTQIPATVDPAATPVPDEAVGPAATPYIAPTVVEEPLPEWQPPTGAADPNPGWLRYDPATGTVELEPYPPVGAASEGADSESSGVADGGRIGPESPSTEAAAAPETFTGLSRVADATVWPWTAIVRLDIAHNELAAGTVFVCSGALVHPNLVITRAGCIYDRSVSYGWTTGITVFPAYNDAPGKYGYATATAYWTPSEWVSSGNFDWDIALIKLDRPLAAYYGGYMGYSYRDAASFFTSTVFQNAGYPNGDSRRMNNRSGRFDAVETERVYINDQWRGMGGSVAFSKISTSDNVFAILSHTRNSGTQVGFTRITQTKFSLITQKKGDVTPSNPDLVPMYVTLAPAAIDAGEYLSSLAFTVFNFSRVTWNGRVSVKVYLSRDSTITSADTLLMTELFPEAGSPIGANTWYGIRFGGDRPQIPIGTPSGNYYVGLIIQDSDADTSNNATNGANAAPITVRAAPPQLKVSPTSLTFNATVGGPAPAAQTLSINTGGWGSFNWTASSDQPWLVLSQTSGGVPGAIQVSINPNGLAAKNYNAKITINAPGANPASTVVPVVFNYAPPVLSVSPASLAFAGTLGAPNPPTQRLTVSFTGGGVYPWTARSDAAWLTVTPAAGDSRSPVITAAVNLEGLRAGVYQATVRIESNGAQGSPKDIPVQLTIKPGVANFQISPARISFVAVAGGSNPGSQGITIVSQLNHAFNWVATVDAPWLPTKRGAGTTPGWFGLAPDITGLAVGDYRTTVVVQDPADTTGATRRSVEVQLSVIAPGAATPILRVAPAVLTFEAVEGGANPAARVFTIDNAGNGSLNWTASSSAPWLKLNKTAGSGKADVSVTAQLGGLTSGTQQGQITVQANGRQVQTVEVYLQLRLPPTLAIDGTYLVFSALKGQGNPADKSFTVRNAGDGRLDWAAVEEIPWLSVTPASGQAPSSARVMVNASTLNPGIYSGFINVTGSGARNSPARIEAKLSMQRGAVLGSYPSLLAFDAVAGQANPAPVTLEVLNDGLGQLEWTVESSAAWLRPQQTAGNVPAFARLPVNVTVNTAGLEPREEPYKGTLTVRTANGEGGPQTVNVLLTIASKARYCRIPVGGSDYILKTTYTKLKLENIRRTATADGGCDLSGQLRVDLPQNANLTAGLSGHVDANNLFIPTSATKLILHIATFDLELADKFSISDEFGIKSEGGTWKLPANLGGKAQKFNGAVQIGPKGISIAGTARFTFPDVNWGNVTMTKLKGQVRITTDFNYIVDLTGDMSVAVPGSSTTSTATGLQISFDQKGVRSGKAGYFEIKGIAGVDIEVKKVIIEGGALKAESAQLVIPDKWGGAEAALYGLVIRNDGFLSVDGGRFKLPEIAVGGDSFKLSSLEGEFKKVSGGYEISAKGTFGIKGMESGRACSLLVDVTIFKGSGGTVVMAISAPDGQQAALTAPQGPDIPANYLADSPDALGSLQLRRLSVGVWCQPGWALGTTGFFLTGVQGTVELRSDSTMVELKVWVESGAKLGEIPLVSMQPKVTIETRPFHFGYEGPTYVLKHKSGNSTVDLWQRRFKSTMEFDYIILHGGFGVEAGLDDSRRFFFAGNGWAEVSVEKGALIHECARICGFGECLEDCLNVPDSSLRLARADAAINMHQLSGQVKVLRWGAGFVYNFADGNISFNRSLLTAAYSSDDVALARQSWTAAQADAASPAPDARIAFEGDESVVLAMPVTAELPGVQAAEVITPFVRTVRSDVMVGMMQPIDGRLGLSLIDPSGVEITPTSLPVNIQFSENITGQTRQYFYSIAAAAVGTWRMKITGPTATTAFYTFTRENFPQPALEGLSVQPATTAGQFVVGWRLRAAEPGVRINIYANRGEITRTLSYTGTNGLRVQDTTDLFVGTLVAGNIPSPSDGSAQTRQIDLRQLSSGTYTIWLEAVGTEGPTLRCYIDGDSQNCRRVRASVVRFVVNNAGNLPSAWSPTISADVDVKRGEMQVNWDLIAHPDVDRYVVRLVTTHSFTPTLNVTRDIEAAPEVTPGKGSLLVDGIEPGKTYRISVQAIDDETKWSVRSGTYTVQTQQPDFVIRPKVAAIVVGTGGSSSLSLALDLDSTLPYSVQLRPDYDRLPDGLSMSIDPSAVSSLITQATVTARISASRTILPGRYLVSIIAQSGTVKHTLSMPVEVKVGFMLYLPAVRR